MNVKLAVYGLWFIFALWSYITLIYSFGFVRFLLVKSKKKKYDLSSNLLDIIFWIFTFAGQILTIYFYLDRGKDLAAKNSDITTLYIVLLVCNTVIMISYVIFLFLLSNNFEVKFTEKNFYFVAVSILNSAIISVKRNKKGHLIVEYVYKKEAGKIWTEKLILHKWFSTANFVEKNYPTYFNPAKNEAILAIDRVSKMSSSLDSTKKTSAVDNQVFVKAKAVDINKNKSDEKKNINQN